MKQYKVVKENPMFDIGTILILQDDGQYLGIKEKCPEYLSSWIVENSFVFEEVETNHVSSISGINSNEYSLEFEDTFSFTVFESVNKDSDFRSDVKNAINDLLIKKDYQ
jgi:hypothetical protein